MGCVLTILRPVAALVLGVIVFFGFLWWLLQDNFSDKLLSAEFYTDTIAKEDTYNRIYDEVLLDEELESATRDLLGGIQVESQAETAALLREIIPPEYLQSQTEASIQRTVAYFNEAAETLDLYVDIGPPLDNVKPALFRYIDQRIDGLAEEDLGSLECTPERVDEVAGSYLERWQRLAGGEAPASIPSLAAFQPGCRLIIFQRAFDDLVAQAGLDQRAERGLRSRRSDLQEHFVAGEAKEVLKAAARSLADPVIDDAIQNVRDELDDQDRLDLIHIITRWEEDYTEEGLRSDIDTGRDWVSSVRSFGKLWALLTLVLAAALLGAVHLPSLKGSLRWPGLTLFLTGLFFFVTAKVLESQVPASLRDLAEGEANRLTDAPPSVTGLAVDLLGSFGERLVGGVDGPALVLLVIGALLFGASFFINYAMLMLRLILLPLRLVWACLGRARRRLPRPTVLGSSESQTPGR